MIKLKATSTKPSFLKTSKILFFLLFAFSAASGQSEKDLAEQMLRMKQDYQEWLSIKPADKLFVEYDPSPMALDIPNPRFSWIMDLEGRGRKQTAYQLLVASSRDILDADEGDIWNTGLRETDQSIQVVYGGLPLESNRQYFWKVRIRDEAGKLHPFSETASFSTGLFSEEEWTAQWIGKGDPCEVYTDVNTFPGKTYSKEVENAVHEPRSPYFRKEFSIEKEVSRARVFISGLGLYELRLNGEKVGDHVLSQSKTDFRKRILYSTYNVTSDLQPGANSLGIILGNGWFNGQKKFWGWQYQWYGSPRVIMQLDIEYSDGSKSRVTTDGSWKSSWDPIVFNCLFDGEHYDARLEQEGWDSPGFDDKTWIPANEVPSPGGKLASSLHETNRITKIIEPLSVSEVRPDTFVFDLGQNIAGWIRLKVNGPAGTIVTMRFAEEIHPDGMIDPKSSRAALQTDQYILKGKGEEIFEPHFTYHGFQYVEVTGYPGKPAKEAVEGCFIHAAVTPAGSFECSNDLINRIHLCTVQSQRCNIQMGVPTDDTQRPERQGWGGDALMTAQEAMLNVSIQRVYSKWYLDYHDQQEKNGQVGYIVPRAGIGDDLVWSSSWVIMPWYQFIHYGDTAVLEENYDALLRYMNYLASLGREDVKPKEMGDNPRFSDYTPDPEMTGYLQQSQWGDHLSLAEGYQSWSGLPLSISTAIYYHDLQVMEKMARVLGKEKHVELYQELAGKVLNAFNTKFLNKQGGYYDVGTQATQAWPLFFGMVPEEYEERVINSLLNNLVQVHDGHPTTGYVGTKYMLDVLTLLGREDLVWDMALKTDFPSWGYSLRNGRTTITEKWSDGGSQNHVVLGAAIDPWFYIVLAGIREDEQNPGFKRFTVKPYIPENDLDWVKASVHSMHGTISSSWKKTKNGLEFQITVPANTTAVFHMPVNQDATIKESGKALKKAVGIRSLGVSDDRPVFELEPGNYVFSVAGIFQ